MKFNCSIYTRVYIFKPNSQVRKKKYFRRSYEKVSNGMYYVQDVKKRRVSITAGNWKCSGKIKDIQGSTEINTYIIKTKLRVA